MLVFGCGKKDRPNVAKKQDSGFCRDSAEIGYVDTCRSGGHLPSSLPMFEILEV